MSLPPPSYLAPIKLANPDSPGKMAVKTERERDRELIVIVYSECVVNVLSVGAVTSVTVALVAAGLVYSYSLSDY